MAQTQNEHLTIEQISASFDKQLSPQEQAIFDAHLTSCQQCQNKLSDLRLTSALLHSLPVEEVPRSFILPGNVSILPDRTIRQDAAVTLLPQKHRSQRTVLRRSIRIVSTLAAVLALGFIISGILPLVSSGGGSYSSTASSSNTMGAIRSTATAPGEQHPSNALPPVGSSVSTPTRETPQSLTPKGTATAPATTEHAQNTGHNPTVMPAIDLNQPFVRLGTGVLVLAISILILIITRRKRVAAH